MVNAHHHGRATQVVFNQMELPKRALRVQWQHGQLGHAVLQRFLLVALGFFSQLFNYHLPGDVKLCVAHPGGATRILHHALGETRVLQQPFFNAVAQGFVADARPQHPHAHDHHEVGIAVHPQPRGIDLAHAFAAQAQRAGDGVLDVFTHHTGGLAGGWTDGCRYFADFVDGTSCGIAGNIFGSVFGDDSGNHENSRKAGRSTPKNDGDGGWNRLGESALFCKQFKP